MEQLILEKYKSNQSCPLIAKELSISKKLVREVLHRNGIIFNKTNRGNVKYSKNIDFFTNPNLNNSYWAGFIAADGHLSQDNGVIIALHEKDTDHLEKFREEIKYSGELKRYKSLGTFSNLKNIAYYSRISVYSKVLCDNLYRNWLVTHNKTYNLQFPNHLENNVKLAYIMGYIDGDGSFIKTKNKFHNLSICGNQDFLENMKNFLCEYLNEPLDAIKIYKDHSIFSLSISRKNVLLKIRNIVQKEFESLPFMKRKWEILFNADLSKGRI